MKSLSGLLFKKSAQTQGQLAEEEAYQFLLNKGLKPETRNYRCKYGEIDLIMWDNSTLVFVEVRYRKNTRYGSGAETVTASKQKKLIVTAQHFMLNHPGHEEYSCRFDVASLSPSEESGKDRLVIEWITGAFTLEQ